MEAECVKVLVSRVVLLKGAVNLYEVGPGKEVLRSLSACTQSQLWDSACPFCLLACDISFLLLLMSYPCQRPQTKGLPDL
jgi:hypothetical protein